MRRMLSLSKTANTFSSAARYGQGFAVVEHHCLLFATIFHAATKNTIAGERMRNPASDLFGAVTNCEEHRDEVLEFVNHQTGRPGAAHQGWLLTLP